MRKIYPLLFVLIVFVSCQKEVSLDMGQVTQTTGGSGGSGGSGSGSSSNSYCPTTNGTWWKYKDSTSGSLSTSTMTSITKTKNGILFTAIQPSGPDTGWMASPTPNYYSMAKGNSPNSGAPYDILFHYLNDTASVGSFWEYNAGQGNGFTAYIKTTVKEKGLTMTVAGKSYSNVIHTQLSLSYDVMGMIITYGYYDYYIAKGVGIIKVRTNIDLGGGIMQQFCSDLVDYSIK